MSGCAPVHPVTKSLIAAGIFHLLMGGLFFCFGLRDYDRVPLIVYLGAGLIAYGIYWLLLAGGLGKHKQP